MRRNVIFLFIAVACTLHVIHYRFSNEYMTQAQIFNKQWYVVATAIFSGFLYSIFDDRIISKTRLIRGIDYAFSICLKLLIIILIIVVILFIDKVNNEPVNRFYRF